MYAKMSRRSALAAAAGAAGSLAIPRPARAAQYVYSLAHDLPQDSPLHVRSVQMAEAVKAQTNGRMEIRIFPNHLLGGQTSELTQLRAGSIQFLLTLDAVYAAVAPVAAIDSVGFAFSSTKQATAALDGPLGAYIRKELASKGLYVFENVFDLGFRQVTSSVKPIKTVDDFSGLRMRTPPAPIFVDLFKTLGASPTPIDIGELYVALQTHVVDAQETPLSSIETLRYFEVQKYLSITNHIWTGNWLAANGDAWNALPPDIQAVVKRNVAQATRLERNDMTLLNAALADKLQRQGLAFNTADVASMRARLAPYYAHWKNEFGPTAWALLENEVGKLS